METMLKKWYYREVALKEAANVAAKENSIREEDRIKYDDEFPLVIDEENRVLELIVLPDEDDFLETRGSKDISTLLTQNGDSFRNVLKKVVRIRFKDPQKEYENEDDEKNPYIMDINTTLNLDEFEAKLMKCMTEEEIYELNEF